MSTIDVHVQYDLITLLIYIRINRNRNEILTY